MGHLGDSWTRLDESTAVATAVRRVVVFFQHFERRMYRGFALILEAE